MSTCALEDLFHRSSSRIGLSLKELQASALTLINMDFQQRVSLFYFIQAKNTEDINILLRAIGQEDFMERQAWVEAEQESILHLHGSLWWS